MARVLFLTLVFAPDGVSTSVLMTELALELKNLGHDIVVLTTTPHYNVDVEARARQTLNKRWGKLLYESNLQGIPVYHSSIPAKGSRVGARFLDYLRFHAISTLAGLTLAGSYDVILAPSPPLTIGLSAWILRLLRGAPFIYNVQEIWPELPVRLGVLRNRTLIRLFEWMEVFVYRQAEAIAVICQPFHRNLLAKGVPPAKLHLIPNFVDTEFVQPQNKLNEFSEEYGLAGKFVTSYAGNIGLTQDFESILLAAVELQHVESLVFLIVGDGARRKWLEDRVTSLGISNVLLLPYQPRSVVPLIYASSDVCLVPLKGGTAQDTFPSKVYTIMSAGRAVIASADPDSELAWVVNEARSGWTIEPDNPNSLAEIIRAALSNLGECKAMGERGRRYVLENHSPRVVAQQYDALIRQLTGAEDS